jgi:hypothetical protein
MESSITNAPSVAAPLIAFDATGQPLAMTFNFNNLFPATVALHLSDS